MNSFLQHEKIQRFNVLQLPGISVILLCFALDDRSSFVHLLENILPLCYESRQLLIDTQFYLLGLKADLEKDRVVTKDEAQVIIIYCEKYNV